MGSSPHTCRMNQMHEEKLVLGMISLVCQQSLNHVDIQLLPLLLMQVPKSEALEATKLAIEVGFRHVHSAHLYQNEEQVGQAIRSKIADGTVKREDIFYTSKVLCVERVQMCASDFAQVTVI